MNESTKKAILGPMRLPFLTLPPVCVFLGTAVAFWRGYEIQFLHLFLAFLGAVLAHIAVNSINEYDDFKSGLDFKTKPTPFSGGSKTLPKFPERALIARITGVTAIIISSFIGIYFWLIRGSGILIVGIPGILMLMAYTRWITHYPVLCLIAPGLGFGPMMVMGTEFALTGSYSWNGFCVSLVPFFLVNNLLLLNQFPDIEADRSVGRKHLLIKWGITTGVNVFGLFLLFTYLAILFGYIFEMIPLSGLLGMVTFFFAIPTYNGVRKNAGSISDLIPFMKNNVLLNLITPTLVAVGLLIGM